MKVKFIVLKLKVQCDDENEDDMNNSYKETTEIEYYLFVAFHFINASF